MTERTATGTALSEIPAGLCSVLLAARRVVVFTGAGVSAESGIATFREALTGLWERFDAEKLATPEPRRPLETPPSVARSKSPSGDDKNGWIFTRNGSPLQGEQRLL